MLKNIIWKVGRVWLNALDLKSNDALIGVRGFESLTFRQGGFMPPIKFGSNTFVGCNCVFYPHCVSLSDFSIFITIIGG